MDMVLTENQCSCGTPTSVGCECDKKFNEIARLLTRNVDDYGDGIDVDAKGNVANSEQHTERPNPFWHNAQPADADDYFDDPQLVANVYDDIPGVEHVGGWAGQ